MSLLVLLGIAASCQGDRGGTAGRVPVSSPLLPELRAGFTECGAAAGLGLVNVSGSREKRNILEANGPGVCALDFDNDGDEDLYVVNGQTLDGSERGRSALYENRGNGTFADVTAASGTGEDGWGFVCAVADYDQDGLADLFVGGWRVRRLYHNQGGGRFEEVSRPGGLADLRWAEGAAFGDFDRDGLPDLYVANYLHVDPEHTPSEQLYDASRSMFIGPKTLSAEADALYRNRGDGTFEDVSTRLGINAVAPAFALGVLFVDVDGDGSCEIYVINDSMPNYLFRREKDGRFADVGLASGLALSGDGREQASMGIAWGDVNEDGRIDLLITNFSRDYNTLYVNEGGTFSDESYASGLGEPAWLRLGWGTVFFDYDHDRHLDLLVSNGHVFPSVATLQSDVAYEQPDLLFHGDGKGAFRLVDAGELTRRAKLARGVIAVDVDRDGDLDLVETVLHAPPALFRNDAAPGASRAFLAPRLMGVDCNRDALGAAATVALADGVVRRWRLGGGSYASSAPARLHFGLGTAPSRVDVDVVWPCGRRERFAAATDSFPTLIEGQGTAR